MTTPSERARTWRLESFGWRRQHGKLACPSPTVQNVKQMGRIATRREFRLRELATRPPSGKRLFKVRSERASKRPRGARGKFESKPAAAVVSAIAHAGAAIAISPTAISATLVVSLADRPRLHDLIPRDDACRAARAIGAEQMKRIACMI